MNYLKPLVNQDVFVFLRGGGVLKGKLLSCAEDHLVVKCKDEMRTNKGKAEVELDRFVTGRAIQWVEANKGQIVD